MSNVTISCGEMRGSGNGTHHKTGHETLSDELPFCKQFISGTGIGSYEIDDEQNGSGCLLLNCGHNYVMSIVDLFLKSLSVEGRFNERGTKDD